MPLRRQRAAAASLFMRVRRAPYARDVQESDAGSHLALYKSDLALRADRDTNGGSLA